ncbi:MAG: ribose 5-phosphate isomerase B [bacterium]
MPIIAIASDHAGLDIKNTLTQALDPSYSILDLGPSTPEKTDYPDFAKKVTNSILNKNADLGILVCGTGIGMSIKANRYKGIRAAVVWDEVSAQLAKKHNNANVLCVGARLHSPEEIITIINQWLETSFEDRHQTRVNKLDQD